MQKYIATFKIPGTLGVPRQMPRRDASAKHATVDNIIADFLAGKGSLFSLIHYHGEPNLSDDTDDDAGTYVDIVLELKKSVVNDFGNHAPFIISKAVEALQAPQTDISYFWTKGLQEHIGFMEPGNIPRN
ncbi:MAG: hypothetical protein ITG00_03155 [Flavobacterium sp.]|nr:hypothetical protein [Flavobacterium sp.]